MKTIKLHTGIDLGFEYVAFYQGQTDTTIIVPKSYDADTFLDAHERLYRYGEDNGLNFSFMLYLNYDKVVNDIKSGDRVEVLL